jgi:RNA polymerase sigma factor for flagellar operon FliA
LDTAADKPKRTPGTRKKAIRKKATRKKTTSTVAPMVIVVEPVGDKASTWKAWFKNPCDETRNDVAFHYSAFVRDLVRRFAVRLPRSVDRGDMETAGSIGLINAIRGFDPERSVRFESYCELRVKGALLDELRSQDWLPRPWRHRIELQKRTVARLRSEWNREPTDEEVGDEMGLTRQSYQRLFGTTLPGTPVGSMPSENGGEDRVPTLDVVPDNTSDAPDEKLMSDDLLTLVTQKLTEQEKKIVYLKYWEELPMREIGQLTGLSESRVCKIHARLLERLQDRFRVHQEEE